MPGRAAPHLIPAVLLTLREVIRMTSLSRSTIYTQVASRAFPRPIRVGARGVRWRADEIQAWIDSRPRAGSEGAAR